jgi:hypothetical protein
MNPDMIDDNDEDIITLDLSTARGNDEDRYLLPDGEYEVDCTDVVQDVSKSGNPMLVFHFVTGAEHKGLRLREYCVTQGSAIFKLGLTLEALGLGKAGEVVKFKKSEAIGRRCIAKLKAEEYNGKRSSKIDRLKPHPKGPRDPNAVGSPF